MTGMSAPVWLGRCGPFFSGSGYCAVPLGFHPPLDRQRLALDRPPFAPTSAERSRGWCSCATVVLPDCHIRHRAHIVGGICIG